MIILIIGFVNAIIVMSIIWSQNEKKVPDYSTD